MLLLKSDIKISLQKVDNLTGKNLFLRTFFRLLHKCDLSWYNYNEEKGVFGKICGGVADSAEKKDGQRTNGSSPDCNLLLTKWKKTGLLQVTGGKI